MTAVGNLLDWRTSREEIARDFQESLVGLCAKAGMPDPEAAAQAAWKPLIRALFVEATGQPWRRGQVGPTAYGMVGASVAALEHLAGTRWQKIPHDGRPNLSHTIRALRALLAVQELASAHPWCRAQLATYERRQKRAACG